MAQVLVVDDDPLIGKTLLDLLSLHGFPAIRAESGERGIEELSTGGFDLVLLDLRLPGMSGFETCSRIRELHGPHLPVIMMTAFGDPVAVRRGYEAGADDFLHKPIDTPALILKVRAFQAHGSKATAFGGGRLLGCQYPAHDFGHYQLPIAVKPACSHFLNGLD